ncbi:MAG TPA: hypothetical protein VMK12_28685 [Anaeromyxobacteraceae bacterium]|nr:hypothetical protein [Anaeromyxobacteraceae bacterium]
MACAWLNHRALTALLPAALGAAACTTLRRVEPVEFFAKNAPDVVWVTYPNKAVVQVSDPAIVSDTLKGFHHGTSNPVAIPLDQIQSVAARLHDGTKTALFVTGLGVVWVSSVYLIWVSQEGPDTAGVLCGTDVRGQRLTSC